MKKALVQVFLLMMFTAPFSGTVRAQSSCQIYDQLFARLSSRRCSYWFFTDSGLPLPNPPADMVCCNHGGIPGGEVCIIPKPECGPPQNAPNEICLGCLGLKSPSGGSPINLATGNVYITETDISIPGLGGGLSVSRIWNSILPATENSYPFMFGRNWRSTYEERLIFQGSDGYLKFARADGSVWSFASSQLGTPNIYMPAAPANDKTTITDGSPNWTMAFKDGTQRLFNGSTGLLVGIVDRNGNTTQLSYDASNRLTTVTDPASRHLTFTYLNSTSNLVSSVTSDVGITYSYSYDAQGRLSKITKPDNTTVSFQFDGNSNITAVLDTDGKILESHTYDGINRGLTSSRANGVDAITVTYP